VDAIGFRLASKPTTDDRAGAVEFLAIGCRATAASEGELISDMSRETTERTTLSRERREGEWTRRGWERKEILIRWFRLETGYDISRWSLLTGPALTANKNQG
jgi:hypothetical protein